MDLKNQQSQNNEILNTQQITNQQAPNLAQTTASINPTTELTNQPNKLSQTIQTNGKAKIIVLLFVFILSLGILFSSISTILKYSKAKNWPNTSGVIVKVDRIGKRSRGNASYTYITEYTVKDKKYSQRFRSKNSGLKTSSNVNVAYNESNPNEAVIIGESGTTFYNYILLFAGIILVPLSTLGLFKTFKNKT